MKEMMYRLSLASLALVLVLAGFTVAYAEGKTSVTIQETEKGVILREETAADEPRYSDIPYIEEHSEKLGPYDDWSLEDKAGYSEWVKEQGNLDEHIFNASIVNGLLTEDNMTAKDVVAKARQAILDKYDVKAAVLDGKFKIQMTFNVIDPSAPLWEIEFRAKDGEDVNDIGYYSVVILDSSGEIVGIYNIDDCVG